MTNFENLVTRVNELLQNEEFHLKPATIFKNNEMKQGVRIESSQMNCCPVIYEDHMLWTKSDEEMVGELRHLYETHACEFDIHSVCNRDYILSHVLPRVYAENNLPEIEKGGFVYTKILDLIVVYYVPILSFPKSQSDGMNSYKVTELNLVMADITKEELIQAATRHMEEKCEIFPLFDLLKEMLESVPSEPDMPQMLVVTNPERCFGAGAIISSDILKQVSLQIGNRFVILPSSIHELLCVPVGLHEDLSTFQSMVQEINATSVLPEDKLTDNIYVYDNGKISGFLPCAA